MMRGGLEIKAVIENNELNCFNIIIERSKNCSLGDLLSSVGSINEYIIMSISKQIIPLIKKYNGIFDYRENDINERIFNYIDIDNIWFNEQYNVLLYPGKFKYYNKNENLLNFFNKIFEAIDVVMDGPKGSYHFTISLFIISLILVPLQCIAEEYVFRGFFMQTLGSWIKIPVLALIIQAVIFASVHGYNTIGNVEIFFSGLIFGFFAWKTNGIEVSSAIHTANNFIISLFVMFGLSSASSSAQLNDAIIIIVFDIILCVLMYYIGKKTDWFGEIKQSE